MVKSLQLTSRWVCREASPLCVFCGSKSSALGVVQGTPFLRQTQEELGRVPGGKLDTGKTMPAA